MTKQLTTNGVEFHVDAEDLPLVESSKWRSDKGRVYCTKTGRELGRVLTNPGRWGTVEYLDGDTHNCQRSNLKATDVVQLARQHGFQDSEDTILRLAHLVELNNAAIAQAAGDSKPRARKA